MVELVGGGSVINGATPSSLDEECVMKIFVRILFFFVFTGDGFSNKFDFTKIVCTPEKLFKKIPHTGDTNSLDQCG